MTASCQEEPGCLWIPHVRTAASMQQLGRRLGALLQPGDLLGLDGPLGAGKTCLVQGLARGLGVPRDVAVGSPTYTLVNQYTGRAVTGTGRGAAPVLLTLFHVDLYRLSSARELDELGLEESAESGGIMAVEWLSRFPQALPPDRLELDVAMALAPAGARSVRLRACGPRSTARLAALRQALSAEARRSGTADVAVAKKRGA